MTRILAALILAVSLITPLGARAAAPLLPPAVPADENGEIVEQVTVDTYGAVDPKVAKHFLSLHEGQRIDQQEVDHDFDNLVRLGGYQPSLDIEPGQKAGTVDMRWTITSRYLRPTTHPYYGDQPLSAPIQGIGWVVTSNPINNSGGSFSSYTQFSRRANLARVLYTQPLTFHPTNGVEDSLVVDTFGGRGVYRASEPEAINVFSWTQGEEALWLDQATNGTQFETGIRYQRSTDELPSAIVATSVYSTYEHPAYNSELMAAVSHGCLSGFNRWYPPYCTWQYRFQATDAIGALGATSKFRVLGGDVARYFSFGKSTLALHGQITRTGGVIPDSFLVCAIAKSYPKPFCGTDQQNFQAEFRINDQLQQPFHLILFTEEASSRVRGSEVPYASDTFTWWPDTGVGFAYRMVRIDVTYGKDGGRIFGGLRGAIF